MAMSATATAGVVGSLCMTVIGLVITGLAAVGLMAGLWWLVVCAFAIALALGFVRGGCIS